MKTRRNLKAATSGKQEDLRVAWCRSRGVHPTGEAARQIAQTCASWHAERWPHLRYLAEGEARKLPPDPGEAAHLGKALILMVAQGLQLLVTNGHASLNASPSVAVNAYLHSWDKRVHALLQTPKWRRRAWRDLQVDQLFAELDTIYALLTLGDL